MKRAPRALSMLVVAVSAASFLPAMIIAAAPAQATPGQPVEPVPTSAATSDRLHTAVTASGKAVLIVHVPGGQAALHSAIKHADTADVTVRHRFGSQGSFSVEVAASDAHAAIARLTTEPGVTGVEQSVSRSFSDTPNDPKLPQEASYLDAVAAPAAWQTQHGSSAIKIAVVDSGIDVGHPDLASKIVSPTYNAHTGGTSITDQVGHGTFVAGVAAAQTNNGMGIAGAGYDSSIIGVKIADANGNISIDDEVAGIRWAASHGANIINLSLGGSDSSASERAAIAYAQSKGALVVAAAGNDGDTVKQYPAAYPGVVAVGATNTTTRKRAGFSSYGSWVTLAAPGVNIYSTTPRAGSMFFPTTSGYARGDGTSFSTPLVSGEAALLKAQNPGMSDYRLKRALIASAHGYQRVGLGAGQVDFALARKHVIPATRPASATVDGTKDRVTLKASSTARQVAFKIDSGAYAKPVKVVNGVAALRWPSWGYANGAHTLRATDCTAYGECNSASRVSTFRLANTAATITAPAAGSTATGRFTVRASHPTGGGLRLLIGGHSFGFDSSSPYSFVVNASTLSNAAHTLQVQLCSTSGRRCASPASRTVRVVAAALHPKIHSLFPNRISPNRNHVRDAGTLRFTLPDAERVVIETLNHAGGVVRYARLGPLGPGKHTWTWRGHKDSGAKLADGSYTVVVATSRVVHGFTERGWVSHSALVDTRAPTFSRINGNGTRFYPAKDRYRDIFEPRTRLSDSGTLTLTVRDARGRMVRTLSGYRAKGNAAITWNGHDRHGHLVAAGTYSWRFTIKDAAGNSRNTAKYHVKVSGKRLTTVTAYVTETASRYTDAGGTDRSCSSASRGKSDFSHGVRLLNSCPASGFELAYAQFLFTVPKAISYRRFAIQAYGHSIVRPSELTTTVQRNDGGLEVPGYIRIRASGNHWHTIATVPAGGHVTAYRHAYASVVLDSSYPGRNDFDLAYARLRVTYVALR